MAAPATSGHAFHHRFDALPDKEANPTAKDNPRLSSEGFSYPDLDARHLYSSASNHSGAAAPAPAMSKLPDFPEFKGFDDRSELFQNNNFFQQYAPHPAASAALVEPQSAQIEASPSSEQLTSTSPAAHQDASAQSVVPAAEPQQPLAQAAQLAPTSAQHQHNHHHQPLPQQPAAELYQQPQLEPLFSSASSYAQQPSLQNSSESQAPSHHSHHSHHSHSSHRSPLPKPPTLPSSPPSQSAHTNGGPFAPGSPSRNPLSQPGANFAFAGHQARPASQQPPHAMSPQQQSPQTNPDSLPMAALRLNDGERSTDHHSTDHHSTDHHSTDDRAENEDSIRPSSFFGMQRPAAALNATGHQVPVPASMLADHDGFYQDQQHLDQANALAQPQPQPQQRNQDAINQGPRPSSFFGVEGDSASSLPSDSAVAQTPASHVGAPGTPRSSFRADIAPRGISTAAGGTGNGPMPSSGGFGGLGPAGTNRPASIAPSVASGPLLDHSHLKVGQKASLLSHGKTLELYRQNAKKTNDPNLIYELAVFMIDAAKTMGTEEEGNAPPTALNGPNKVDTQKEELTKEATGLLKKIADRGHPDAQYFLADCYANGIGTRTGKQDFGQAYTYFVLAAKHGHPDAAYRAGTCYEKGWGCRKDAGKALQFYRKSAAQSHPGAMYRLATAELNGELGLKKNAKEGVKWLKRSAEAATPEFPHALHELALLHERGIDNVLFVDPEYSCELLAQAGEMGYAPSAYKLGVNYEYGRMGCPQDGGLSIHMYNIAAQQNHKEACFALTAWYLVGAPGILPQSDTEAYLWAKKAAEQGLAKAEYAVGYFTEMGIGTVKDLAEAKAWYKRAADHGDKRANQRVAALQGHGGPTGLADANAAAPVNRQQQRMEQRQEQRQSMHEFGRRAQPTSAPFPASVTQSSMTPSTQMSYPSPLAMREAQTAQRQEQYMANVAANERAQARAMLPRSPSQQEFGSPISAGSPTTGLPRPPFIPTPQHQQQLQSPQAQPSQPSQPSQPQMPFSQPQAYPSYPMSASTAPRQQHANGPQGPHNPLLPPGPPGSGPGPGPSPQYAARPGIGPGGGSQGGPGYGPPPPDSAAPAKADLGDDGKKKKKGWFARS
ncbi:hypothetical protein NDA14_007857 [Ustilago hordei]|nr:hypothetical protein NDA14_007857 [Ustilago hordei]